jgi:hypothetical protein
MVVGYGTNMSRPPPSVVRVHTFLLGIAVAVLVAWQLTAWAAPIRSMTSLAPQAQSSGDSPPTPLPAELRPEVNEEFRGHHRARAKTEYVMLGDTLAPIEKFDSLQALSVFLRPQADSIMRQRYPSLSKADTDASRRVAEERHNVSVVAYIYAVKHETGKGGDNDFHVILGSSPTAAGIYLTAEASALPHKGAHRNLIANSRQQLLLILGQCRCNARFRRVSPPIKVRVSGSLFFDGEHATGTEGPKYAKTFTAWEIHPILTIERLDEG